MASRTQSVRNTTISWLSLPFWPTSKAADRCLRPQLRRELRAGSRRSRRGVSASRALRASRTADDFPRVGRARERHGHRRTGRAGHV